MKFFTSRECVETKGKILKNYLNYPPSIPPFVCPWDSLRQGRRQTGGRIGHIASIPTHIHRLQSIRPAYALMFKLSIPLVFLMGHKCLLAHKHTYEVYVLVQIDLHIYMLYIDLDIYIWLFHLLNIGVEWTHILHCYYPYLPRNTHGHFKI